MAHAAEADWTLNRVTGNQWWRWHWGLRSLCPETDTAFAQGTSCIFCDLSPNCNWSLKKNLNPNNLLPQKNPQRVCRGLRLCPAFVQTDWIPWGDSQAQTHKADEPGLTCPKLGWNQVNTICVLFSPKPLCTLVNLWRAGCYRKSLTLATTLSEPWFQMCISIKHSLRKAVFETSFASFPAAPWTCLTIWGEKNTVPVDCGITKIYSFNSISLMASFLAVMLAVHVLPVQCSDDFLSLF